jgi:hypothetical protein
MIYFAVSTIDTNRGVDFLGMKIALINKGWSAQYPIGIHICVEHADEKSKTPANAP